jgi:hypothetical protein
VPSAAPARSRCGCRDSTLILFRRQERTGASQRPRSPYPYRLLGRTATTHIATGKLSFTAFCSNGAAARGSFRGFGGIAATATQATIEAEFTTLSAGIAAIREAAVAAGLAAGRCLRLRGSSEGDSRSDQSNRSNQTEDQFGIHRNKLHRAQQQIDRVRGTDPQLGKNQAKKVDRWPNVAWSAVEWFNNSCDGRVDAHRVDGARRIRSRRRWLVRIDPVPTEPNPAVRAIAIPWSPICSRRQTVPPSGWFCTDRALGPRAFGSVARGQLRTNNRHKKQELPVGLVGTVRKRLQNHCLDSWQNYPEGNRRNGK